MKNGNHLRNWPKKKIELSFKRICSQLTSQLNVVTKNIAKQLLDDVSEFFLIVSDVDDTESAWKLNKEKDKPLKEENKIHLNILLSALTCWIFSSSSFRLSPSSLVAVMANWYTFPLSNVIFNSLTETSLMFFIIVHCPTFPSVTTLWYTVYMVITFPLLSGSFHFRVIVSSFVSSGSSSISTTSGAPRLMSTTQTVWNFY